ALARVLFVVYRCFFFFFQAEDGIRAFHVTGVQTCALPICWSGTSSTITPDVGNILNADDHVLIDFIHPEERTGVNFWSAFYYRRSEERRVGKECRDGGTAEP